MQSDLHLCCFAMKRGHLLESLFWVTKEISSVYVGDIMTVCKKISFNLRENRINGREINDKSMEDNSIPLKSVYSKEQ